MIPALESWVIQGDRAGEGGVMVQIPALPVGIALAGGGVTCPEADSDSRTDLGAQSRHAPDEQ